MKQTETARLLAVVKTAYPHFEISDPVVKLWHQMLLDLTFQAAQQNLIQHIKTNRYPPTIADVLKKDADQFTDHNALRVETNLYLQQRESVLALDGGWTGDDDDV